MSVTLYKTVWGYPRGENCENWKKDFPKFKAQGYAGVEIDIGAVPKDELPIIRKIAEDNGLLVSALIFSEWPMYEGPRPKGLKADDHIKFYRGQLENARILGAVRVNGHTGCDYWPISESVDFYRKTLAVDAEMGYAGRVSHETHRNRSFFNPYNTDAILKEVPEIKITADYSHWVVGCERLLVEHEDRELLARVAPHVTHIHSRMGTTQASQCPEPLNPVFANERVFFEKAWQEIIDATFARGNTNITMVPEYGPFPYHPINSKKLFSEVADEEGARVSSLLVQHFKSLGA